MPAYTYIQITITTIEFHTPPHKNDTVLLHLAWKNQIMFSLRFTIPLVFIIIFNYSTARELRPSDHGLNYQLTSSPPVGADQKLPPEMKQFFRSAPNSKSSSSSSSGSTMAALPRAMNSNDTTWWNHVTGGGDRKAGDRLSHILLIGSLVCGATGVALLVVSGFIYLRRYNSDDQKEIVNGKPIVVTK